MMIVTQVKEAKLVYTPNREMYEGNVNGNFRNFQGSKMKESKHNRIILSHMDGSKKQVGVVEVEEEVEPV